MPNTITKYECTICKGIYDTPEAAQACEGRHPAANMQFARSAQTFLPNEVMPDSIKYTQSGKVYFYYLKKR